MPMIAMRAAVLAVTLLLAACVWPMDTVPTRDLRFSGSITGPGSGAPVAGVRVSIWLVPPEQVGASAPFVTGETDASGTFALRERDRNRAIPLYVTVRLEPPPASGLQGWTGGGVARDVFTRIETSEDTVRYTGQFTLEPARS